MKISEVNTAELKFNKLNPRKHSVRQVNELERSLDTFGQYRPMVVDEDNVVLIGNGLLEALLQRGDTVASAYVVTTLSEADKRRLMVADNRLSDMSSDDYDALQDVLRSIGDFDVPGYDEDSLRDLLSDAEDFLEEASAYGVLPTDEVEKAVRRSDEVRAGAAESMSSIGRAPEPPWAPGGDGGTGPGRGGLDAAGDHASICPTCGQSWL